jgi:hypothetical protein
MRAINSQPLDKGSKIKKWQIEAKPPCQHFGEKINWFELKKRAKKESLWFEEPRSKPGFKPGFKPASNSRVQFAWKESKLVPRNLEPGPHLKWALVAF